MKTRDFSPAERHALGLMAQAAQTLPDDFWLLAGVQELACLYAQIEPLLTQQQRAVIIGVGALIANEAGREMAAENDAKLALARAASAMKGGKA